MAPKGVKRKLSMQEQAAAWQQKALIMNNRANTARLLSVLKARPDILPSIMEHLDRLGVKAPRAEPAEGPSTPSPAKPSWSPMLESSSAAGSGGSSDVVSEAGSMASMSDLDLEEKTPLDQIPRKYPTVSSLPVHYLKLALTTLEPISFGVHTLKGLLEPGKKSLPKQELLNLIEFVTDIRPETQIQPHQRSMPAFLGWLTDENNKKNRRGKELQLRVDWSTKGHYLIAQEVSKGKPIIKVKAQHVGLEAALPEKVSLGISDPSKLVVASNWSIHDASLKELGSPFSVNLVLLFPDMCQKMISVGLPEPVPQPVADALQPPAAEGAQCTGPGGPEGQQAATDHTAGPEGALPGVVDESTFVPPEPAAEEEAD